MAGHDIVVVGASAGGVEALSTLVGDLPEDLPTAVFIVLHMGPHSETALARILARRTKLPTDHPHDGQPIEPGRIYVAVSDRHLLVARGRVRVTDGPQEHGHRPSVDTLFRSAAATYGRRVVGVVLSGTGDDGTAGLRVIHDRGGLAVVQDPDEAMFPGMPRSALAGGLPDHVLPVGAIGALLSQLARDAPAPRGRAEPLPDELDAETGVEEALWTAYRALEERVALCGRLADRAHGRHAEIIAEHFKAEAAEVGRQSEVLRAALWSRPADEGESGPTEG